jgi:hypothetical protein
MARTKPGLTPMLRSAWEAAIDEGRFSGYRLHFELTTAKLIKDAGLWDDAICQVVKPIQKPST